MRDIFKAIGDGLALLAALGTLYALITAIGVLRGAP